MNKAAQRTEIWSGLETTSKKSFRVLSRAKQHLIIAMILSLLSFWLPMISIFRWLSSLKRKVSDKDLSQRFITEITQENVRYSKELANHVELRHLEGVKGNFGIVDGKEYGAAANIYDLQPLVEFIYSNVKTFVEQ
jgi:hypothetical protein